MALVEVTGAELSGTPTGASHEYAFSGGGRCDFVAVEMTIPAAREVTAVDLDGYALTRYLTHTFGATTVEVWTRGCPLPGGTGTWTLTVDLDGSCDPVGCIVAFEGTRQATTVTASDTDGSAGGALSTTVTTEDGGLVFAACGYDGAPAVDEITADDGVEWANAELRSSCITKAGGTGIVASWTAAATEDKAAVALALAPHAPLYPRTGGFVSLGTGGALSEPGTAAPSAETTLGVCWIALDEGESVSAVTFGAYSFTLIDGATVEANGRRLEAWELRSPPTASTHDFTVTATAGKICGAVEWYSGTPEAAAWATPVTGTGLATDLSVTLDATDADQVFAGCCSLSSEAVGVLDTEIAVTGEGVIPRAYVFDNGETDDKPVLATGDRNGDVGGTADAAFRTAVARAKVVIGLVLLPQAAECGDILDHADRAIARLRYQFRGLPNWEALLRALCASLQRAECEIVDLREGLKIENANTVTLGRWLDRLGWTDYPLGVDQPLSDLEWRRFIVQQGQLINACRRNGGLPDDVIARALALDAVFADLGITYTEHTGATVVIDFGEMATPALVFAHWMLRRSVASGVRIVVREHAAADYYGFAADPNALGMDEVGSPVGATWADAAG